MMGDEKPYDIYVVEHVEELKREYADLRGRYEEAVRENAELCRDLDRLRRREAMGWER